MVLAFFAATASVILIVRAWLRRNRRERMVRRLTDAMTPADRWVEIQPRRTNSHLLVAAEALGLLTAALWMVAR